MPTAEQFTLANAVAYMCPPFQADPEAVDLPHIPSSIPGVYDADLDAEGEWNLSDILRSGETEVCSTLWVDLATVRDKCIEYSVESPTNPAGLYSLTLPGLNSIGKQCKLLVGVDGLYCTIWSS